MKRTLMTLVSLLLVLSLAVLMTSAYRVMAADDCRDQNASCDWPQWHPYWWYFKCYLPECGPIIVDNGTGGTCKARR